VGDAARHATEAAVRLAACTRMLQELGLVNVTARPPRRDLFQLPGDAPASGPCAWGGAGYRPAAMPEPGLVTLVKIVGTLLGAMSVVPFLFLFAPGDRKEPTETFDGDVQ
jgi:hypothetical protein